MVEIEEECDPPAFTRGRKDAMEEQEIAKEMAEALGSEEVRRVEANPTALVQQVRTIRGVSILTACFLFDVTGTAGYRTRPQ